MYMTPEEQRRQALGYNADPEDRRFGGGGGSLGGAAAPAAAGAAGGATAATSAMPWVNTIASALAERQQEEEAKREARASLAAQYASSQGDFPMYGLQAIKKRRAIDNSMGGPGLGSLRRLGLSR